MEAAISTFGDVGRARGRLEWRVLSRTPALKNPMIDALKSTALLTLLPASLLCSGPARAACTSTPGMPYLQAIDTIAAESNLAVGATIPGTARHYTLTGKCDYGEPYQVPGAVIVACYYGSGKEVMPGVYSTGVSGLGIRLRNAAGEPMLNAAGRSCDTRGASLGALNADMTYSVSVSTEFVKTGSIAAGALDPSQTRFGFGVYHGNGLGGTSNYIGFSGMLQVRQIACNATYPAAVRLPRVKASTLASAGATAGATPFAIVLNCNGTARVGVSFDAAGGSTVKSAQAGVLGPANEGAPGAAGGVGVQLTDARTNPVPLQQSNPVGTIDANAPATYAYALRYFALAPHAKPGVVSGAMTFTFDYQ
ncbi:fimbrial protein [Cupriavidus pinatubonensis]|nr:fimbrial protein [Cupriavidus pinatubonensis]